MGSAEAASVAPPRVAVGTAAATSAKPASTAVDFVDAVVVLVLGGDVLDLSESGVRDELITKFSFDQQIWSWRS